MTASGDFGESRAEELRPEEIEARSMEIIASLLPPDCCRPHELSVVMRMVHASGDPHLAAAIRFHPQAVAAGVEALRRGVDVVVDTQMVLSGIDRRRLSRLGGEVICGITDAAVARKAAETGRTRAATALRLLAHRIEGAVVAVGNAPTGLREVLSLAAAGVARPALVIGMPVGFVDAVESKSALMASDLVWISLEGTRGGSSLAVAAVNALLHMAESS